jgi:predicted dehydrogenase
MVQEGRKMVDAARRNRRVVQAGSQQRSGAHYIQAVELIQNGRIISTMSQWRAIAQS